MWLGLSTVNEAFQALFFGTGSWFGLILMLILIVGLVLKWKESAVLMVPVSVLLGLQYLDYDLGTHTLIMWLASCFIVLWVIKELTK